MLLKSCLCNVLCTEGLRSTWGTSLRGDKLGARDRILNTKVVRRACAGSAPVAHRANIPPSTLRPPCSVPLFVACTVCVFVRVCVKGARLFESRDTPPPLQTSKVIKPGFLLREILG